MRQKLSIRQQLALTATLNPYGRASITSATSEGVYERAGFVMATVKDANDSAGFKPIESFDFAYDQSWFELSHRYDTPSL